MKNLVLGTAINLDFSRLRNFILSFREQNKIDDICFIVDKTIDAKTKSFFLDHDVKTIYFETRHLFSTAVNNTRWFKYLDFLMENEYQNILFTDVTDVIFQGNIFSFLPDSSYIFFFEESETISQCDVNSYWLRCCFGYEESVKIGHQKISCSGTILCDRNNAITYLNLMVETFLKIKSESRDVFGEIIDQGIHNYICYNLQDRFINPEFKPNGEIVGTLATLIYKYRERISMSDNLIKIDDEIPILIHQYNRDEYYLEKINTQYES